MRIEITKTSEQAQKDKKLTEHIKFCPECYSENIEETFPIIEKTFHFFRKNEYKSYIGCICIDCGCEWELWGE